MKSHILKISKFYDKDEEIKIEEKICNRFKELTPLVNKIALHREFGIGDRVNQFDNKTYIFRGLHKLIKD